MKKLYIAIGVILLALLALGCSGSNQGTGNTQQTTQVETPQPALTLSNQTLTPESYGGYTATGTAVANKDLKYAEVDAQFYDKDGALVYNSLTNTQNIKNGTVWKYRIYCSVDKSVKVTSCNVTVGTCN